MGKNADKTTVNSGESIRAAADQTCSLDALTRTAGAKARLKTKAGVPPITQGQAEILEVIEAQKAVALEKAWATLLMRGGVSNAPEFMGPLEAAGVAYGMWAQFIQEGAAITQVVPPGEWDGKTTDLKILALPKPEGPSIIPVPDPGWEAAQGPPPEIEDEFLDLVRAIVADPNIVRDLNPRQKNLLILGQCLDAAKLPGLNPPPADQVIEGVLDRGDVALLAAPSKAGKSLFGFGLALAAADGDEFCGLRFGRRRRVLVFDNELSKEAIHSRAKMMAGTAQNDDDGRFLYVVPLRASKLKLAADQLAPMAPLIQECGVDLIVLDCAYGLYPTVGEFSENSNSDIAKFMTWISEFSAAANVATILIHHAGKGDGGSRSIVDFSVGAGAFARAPRALINIRPRHIRGDKALPVVPVLEVVASNYASPPPRVLYLDGVSWRLRQPGDPIPEVQGDESGLWADFPNDPIGEKTKPRGEGRGNWQRLWNEAQALLGQESRSATRLADDLCKRTGDTRANCRGFVAGLRRHNYLREGDFGLLEVNRLKPFTPEGYESDEAWRPSADS